jgi:hypothetical protein
MENSLELDLNGYRASGFTGRLVCNDLALDELNTVAQKRCEKVTVTGGTNSKANLEIATQLAAAEKSI